MFPRKKKNRTGTISVVVVDKSRGGFKEIKSFGVAKTSPTIKLSLPYGDTERVKTLFLTEKHQRIKPLFDIRAILNKKQNYTNRRTREQGDASPKSGNANKKEFFFVLLRCSLSSRQGLRGIV